MLMEVGEVRCVLGEVGVLPFVGVAEADFVGVIEGVAGEVERMSSENMLRVGVCGVAVTVGVTGGLMRDNDAEDG